VVAVGANRPVRREVGLASLLPYLRVHRVSLVLVAVLSLARAGGTLLQPLLTRSVLNAIGHGPVGRYVAGIEEVLGLPAEDSADRPRPGASVSRAAPAIELDRVTFGYGDGEPVLHEVSFRVPYGTRTALVGPSGAGKSTVLALVERFYEPNSGALRVGGVDIRDLPRAELRRQLGYVEQESPVLAGTIRENLRLTTPGATDAEMLGVLDAVNLCDIVGRTPLGLDAQVGEGGVLLSGGERQRLAIARALLAAPPILLLDEPTSNLDARNEAALRAAIDAVAERRTLLIIAHRLSTVVDADQIVVLDGGRVVATGRHDELTEASPLYRELASHQLLVA
jgi:ABC-type multidrug transport system fused ATPase/permease subunit